MKYHFRLQKHSFYRHTSTQFNEKCITLPCYLHEIETQKHGYWRPKAMLLNPKSIAKDREFAHKTRNKLTISILQKRRIFAVFATKDMVGCK